MTDGGPHWRDIIQLPVRLDDMGLTPAAFRVYCHFVRSAMDDTWESSEEIAQKCKISKNTLYPIKKQLEAAGLITIERRWDSPKHYITILDIWGRKPDASN